MEIGHKITIQCVASTEGCKRCVFSNGINLFQLREKDCRIKCMNYERKDNTSVIFLEVEESKQSLQPDANGLAIDSP